MKQFGIWLFIFLGAITVNAQHELKAGVWQAQLLRADGHHIVFNFEVNRQQQKTVLYILNEPERLLVNKIKYAGDSVLIQMPVFESEFRAKLVSANRLEGSWIKASSRGLLTMPFVANAQNNTRFAVTQPAARQVNGRWAIDFFRNDSYTRPAVGEFVQKGNRVTGSILTPTGDYRYLSGVVNGDSLHLSTFDGSHAFFFTAKISSDNSIEGGKFYSGATSTEQWIAVKRADAVLPELAGMRLKEGEERLNFRFRDISGKFVSINDARYKNKVVIVQIMGSWCPNCMDETAFLSDFYNRYRQRGVEVIGLAYEYTTDFERSRNSVRKFRERFRVQYPLLITGVTVTDSLRTEKTLPQFTPIKSFPSTIFIDKQGRVAKTHAGFAGPGTGEHYQALKKEFEATVDRLLKQ